MAALSASLSVSADMNQGLTMVDCIPAGSILNLTQSFWPLAMFKSNVQELII